MLAHDLHPPGVETIDKLLPVIHAAVARIDVLVVADLSGV
jgi:hypothetical protein